MKPAISGHMFKDIFKDTYNEHWGGWVFVLVCLGGALLGKKTLRCLVGLWVGGGGGRERRKPLRIHLPITDEKPTRGVRHFKSTAR